MLCITVRTKIYGIFIQEKKEEKYTTPIHTDKEKSWFALNLVECFISNTFYYHHIKTMLNSLYIGWIGVDDSPRDPLYQSMFLIQFLFYRETNQLAKNTSQTFKSLIWRIFKEFIEEKKNCLFKNSVIEIFNSILFHVRTKKIRKISKVIRIKKRNRKTVNKFVFCL